MSAHSPPMADNRPQTLSLTWASTTIWPVEASQSCLQLADRGRADDDCLGTNKPCVRLHTCTSTNSKTFLSTSIVLKCQCLWLSHRFAPSNVSVCGYHIGLHRQMSVFVAITSVCTVKWETKLTRCEKNDFIAT